MEQSKEEKVTAYRLYYGVNNQYENAFLTLDRAEVDMKVLELMQDNEIQTFKYMKFKTTRAMFLHELQEIIS